MKQNLYIVYDSKTELYDKPTFAPNNGTMIRSFTDVANNKQHPIGQHPEDYTLFNIGSYDEETGTITQEKTKISVCQAHELIKTEE